MMSYSFAESDLESLALSWLQSLGWAASFGPEIAPDAPGAERSDYREVVLGQRLRDALARLNPHLPADALEDAFRRLTRPEGATLEARNRSFHRMLVDGVTVEYRRDGRVAGAQVRVIDFDNPSNNDWLAVNQYTVMENRSNRRPDIVLFVNGLPLAIMELKNPADEEATIHAAFQQLQTYKSEIPSLFTFNEVLVISDGLNARLGTLTADWEWFKPWRNIPEETEKEIKTELEVLMNGVFDHQNFLDLLRDFIVFEDKGSGRLTKKIAGYHQFHAVKVAVEETLRAAGINKTAKSGDRRIGVVWHTQGSGKSLTMVFYAACIIRKPELKNPTVVVITDRNDLDDQLFDTFSLCREILRQDPVQAKSRADLRERLKVEAGGIVFTTIQKFLSDDNRVLSRRENIIVIADEAHRSQYDFIDGFARHMRDALPNASFIAFTGTPLELEDRNTRAVFGDYISIYDIERAVTDGATVPIYYESRLAKLKLPDELKPKIDEEFEEVTEGEECDKKEKLKRKWAQLESIVGAERRIRMIANDIVNHFEERLAAMKGKAMIVCMSRRICVEMYKEIVRLRPQWHDDDDSKGEIKIVMTGSASDPAEWQPHIRNKSRRRDLADRFRDPDDPFKIVIVRDMWLTGFDCPCLHTMYIDKPMRSHGLMQAIARVNRVFRDKPGGLVVDYIGLAYELKKALATYTASGGKGRTAIDLDEVVAIMLEKYEICCDMFHGFDRSGWKRGSPEERLKLLPAAQEHILSQTDGKNRFIEVTSELSKAFSLAASHELAMRIRDDVAFFQAVRSALLKRPPSAARSESDMARAIKEIINCAIAPDGIEDIFKVAGLKKPDISILSEEFLAEVRGMPQKNLSVELLNKLLSSEIRERRRRNIVQARSFAELLQNVIRRYHNRAIDTVQVIEELIAIARKMRESDLRGEKLGLSEEELAFYDALCTSNKAIDVLGDDNLKKIARELVETLRSNVTVDWTMREDVRAKIRVEIKHLLRRHKYPTEIEDTAVSTILDQAETLAARWSSTDYVSAAYG